MIISEEVQKDLHELDNETRKKLIGLIDDMDRALCGHGVSTHNLILCREESEDE